MLGELCWTGGNLCRSQSVSLGDLRLPVCVAGQLACLANQNDRLISRSSRRVCVTQKGPTVESSARCLVHYARQESVKVGRHRALASLSLFV